MGSILHLGNFIVVQTVVTSASTEVAILVEVPGREIVVVPLWRAILEVIEASSLSKVILSSAPVLEASLSTSKPVVLIEASRTLSTFIIIVPLVAPSSSPLVSIEATFILVPKLLEVVPLTKLVPIEPSLSSESSLSSALVIIEVPHPASSSKSSSASSESASKLVVSSPSSSHVHRLVLIGSIASVHIPLIVVEASSVFIIPSSIAPESLHASPSSSEGSLLEVISGASSSIALIEASSPTIVSSSEAASPSSAIGSPESIISLISPEVIFLLEPLGLHFLSMLNHFPLVYLLNFPKWNQFKFVVVPHKFFFNLLGTLGFLEGNLIVLIRFLFLEFLDLSLEEKVSFLEVLDVLVLHFVDPDGFLKLMLGLFLLDACIL